ncbi:MAG TPA: glycosyltransferase, partial [Patescibacteria group bacterium]|nr:glycosyltransferase [Patescibacteria group bacterium]
QACGKPVIAYGRGGALETVVPGKTGEFFKEQTVDSLVEALKRFDPSKYRPEDCRKNAESFSKTRFQKELVEIASRAVGVE